MNLTKLPFVTSILTLSTLSCAPPEKKNLPLDRGDQTTSKATGSEETVLPLFKGFLKPSDVKAPDKVANLDENAPHEELVNFFANFGKAEGCVQRQVDEAPIQAAKTTLKVEGNLDLSTCPEEDGTTSEGRFRFLVAFSCDSADLSDLNGKPSRVVLDDDNLYSLCKSGQGVILANFSLVSTFHVTHENGAFSLQAQSKSGTMSRSGEGCKFTVTDGKLRTENDCLEFDVSHRSGDGLSENSFFLAEYRNVSSEVGSKFVTSGSKDVTVNDWKGTVTFHGPTTPPSYSLSKGKRSAKGTIIAK